MIVVFAIILVVIAVILVVVASIGEVIAVFAKNKGPEFEIFFKNSKMVFISCFKQIPSQYIVLLQISFPRLCKINFKDEAISVGHPV